MENNLANDLGSTTGRKILAAIKLTLIILVFAGFFSLFMFNFSRQPSAGEKVWDKRTTIGDLNAKNHYVMYTDILCPYCSVFSNIVRRHDSEFKDYLNKNNILWEVRMTDFLKQYGRHATEYSEWGAEAIFCAKREDRFWEYYYKALEELDIKYHQKGIGISSTSPQISDMKRDFWSNIGKAINLSDNFHKCYNDHEALSEVKANTDRAIRVLGESGGGVPFFKFNQATFSGVDPNDTWEKIKLRLDKGLK